MGRESEKDIVHAFRAPTVYMVRNKCVHSVILEVRENILILTRELEKISQGRLILEPGKQKEDRGSGKWTGTPQIKGIGDPRE